VNYDPCAHKVNRPTIGDTYDVAYGICRTCNRRVTRFWIEAEDDRVSGWSRWKLETVTINEDLL
jgi:hypothetical protein